MDDSLKVYRQQLVDTLQKVSESYDKTVLTLSGGALGVSFTFITDFIGNKIVKNSELLFWGWIFLSISISSVLLSLFFGTLAFRKAISQVDDGTIYDNKPGGWLGNITIILHSSGAVFLIVGLLLLGNFIHSNIGEQNGNRETNAAIPTYPPKTVLPTASKSGQGKDSSRSAASASASEEVVSSSKKTIASSYY